MACDATFSRHSGLRVIFPLFKLTALLLSAGALALAASAQTVPASASAQTVPAPAHPLVGVGDENLAMFSDARFLALGITQVRYYTPWDVLSSAYKNSRRRDALVAWLADARALGMTPLITFNHSDRPGRARRLPSVAQYSKAFLSFRKLYPWVTEFATWNEANYYGEPTAGDPRRVAGYYLALRRDCPTCTILAAELLDINNARQAVGEVRWARAFIRDAHTQPEYWGLHNYVSANTLSEASVKALLAAVSGNIWLTETGGVVALPHRGLPGFPLTAAHQARVDNFLLNRLPGLSPRIQRVYLYEWRSLRKHANWDSALVAYDNEPRPAYAVLANTLSAWGVAPDCTISSAPPACAALATAAPVTVRPAGRYESPARAPSRR